ncbi:MAG: hypothetical protein PHO30_05285, partial [Candidatus Omnitrophica bacterium]|nr:hypothetical protein [Candidatus Omnitrophota bacterium]
MMTEREYLIALNMVPGLGSLRIANLLNYFSLPSRIFAASGAELAGVDCIGSVCAERIRGMLASREFAEEMGSLQSSEICAITLVDDGYPELLRQIYDP